MSIATCLHLREFKPDSIAGLLESTMDGLHAPQMRQELMLEVTDVMTCRSSAYRLKYKRALSTRGEKQHLPVQLVIVQRDPRWQREPSRRELRCRFGGQFVAPP
ncbi:hypothetical protein P168DRAFT_3184 [Aspergillus campestris IBT 28561]|uniref:Uncharacterized protein n=1 Tax=Aspergillus campestris (strain IBT 28561) TaxID=1392248 RepID=A0A2I1DD76_ASPC2|nr:uncharacterized protein P168DRAFT_3184 [Aspergillus campestris IBT 28561]PKY07832.1 hypothetical protein P168DRAFT_3184 [Aspergillus campestris IBT 28561]